MTEASLKSAFVAEAKKIPGFVILRHEDKISSGMPDISVTGGGRTTWIETKYAKPRLVGSGIQELTMLRLAAAGVAYYLVWEEKRDVRRTLLVHPRHLHNLLPQEFFLGFDHLSVVDWFRRLHGV